MLTKSQIDEVVRKVVEGYQPEKIILFGSYLKGTATDDSDLDLCVVKADFRSRRARHREVEMLLADRNFSIDILVFRPEELANPNPYDSFTCEIAKMGKVIYER